MTHLILVSLILAGLARADSPAPPPADTGDPATLFNMGRYQEALTAQRAAQPVETAPYYYNLGTTALRLGQTGLARAYLEKAQRLAPWNADVRRNLATARQALERVLGPERAGNKTGWISALDSLPLREIGLAASLALAISSLLWVIQRLRSGSAQNAAFASAVALGLVSGAQSLVERAPAVAVLEQQALRSGPGDTFLELGRYEAGVLLRATGEAAVGKDQSRWLQVRGPAGGTDSTVVGWMKEPSLLPLSPRSASVRPGSG